MAWAAACRSASTLAAPLWLQHCPKDIAVPCTSLGSSTSSPAQGPSSHRKKCTRDWGRKGFLLRYPESSLKLRLLPAAQLGQKAEQGTGVQQQLGKTSQPWGQAGSRGAPCQNSGFKLFLCSLHTWKAFLPQMLLPQLQSSRKSKREGGFCEIFLVKFLNGKELVLIWRLGGQARLAVAVAVTTWGWGREQGAAAPRAPPASLENALIRSWERLARSKEFGKQNLVSTQKHRSA